MSDAENKTEGGGEVKEKKAKAHRIDREHKKSKWTMERCQKSAKRFSSVEDWKSGSPSSYKAAFAHDWVAKCSSHMRGAKTSKRVG